MPVPGGNNMRPIFILATLAVATSLVAPALADGINPGARAGFTPPQEAEIGAVVGRWLADHPDAIRQALLSRTEGGIPLSRFDGVMGATDADTTVIVFLDRGTPLAAGTVIRLAALAATDPKLRVVIKELPLASAVSLDAAMAAVAVRNQGEKPFHLFEGALSSQPGTPTLAGVQAAVVAAGLDAARFARDLSDPSIKAYLKEVRAYADDVGIHGTPTFVVGRTKIEGTRTVDELRQLVAASRAP